MPNEQQTKAIELVNHTRELYAAILRARAETSGLVLKDMGDAIYDAIPWEDLATPVKQALVVITRELMYANTEKLIRDVEADDGQTSIDYEKPVKESGGAFTRFGSDEIENEADEADEATTKLEKHIDEAKFTQPKTIDVEAEIIIPKAEAEPTEENTRPEAR